MIEKYYEEELRNLYESGRDFANAHPDRARYLNVDSLGDRDPYIERLFEGFAFLTGRIREKLDDAFPQLTEGLINLLWPQFLQELPSLAIVQFQPRPGIIQEYKILPARSEIMSGPVGQNSAICKFTTTQNVIINPMILHKVVRETDTNGHHIVSFIFNLDSSIEWHKYNLQKIRLFIHAEMPTALSVHRLLTREVKKIDIQLSEENGWYSIDPRNGVVPAGFESEESLLPKINPAFWGYNLLREYFLFPEKFVFIDLQGIDLLPEPNTTPSSIIYRITVDGQIPSDKHATTEMFKLNCCPVINMFKSDTDPVIKTGQQPEYRVTADSTLKKSIFVHSICSVTGVDKKTGIKTVYEPAYTFGNIGNRSKNTYSTRVVKTATGKREVVIMIGGPQLQNKEVKKETLSIEAWCTNGNLPREVIHEADINSPGRGFPDFVQIENITRPTMPVYPPLADDYLWMFQTHLAATNSGLASKNVLKKFLHLYNWSESEGNKRRIEAVTDVSSKPVEKVYKGSIIRGISFMVTIEEMAFSDSGDLHLFGLVMSSFLSQYVQINTFFELQFLLKPSGSIMKWNNIEGKRCLI